MRRALTILVVSMFVLGLLSSGISCIKTESKPLSIVHITKESRTVHWNSTNDFLLLWTITVTVHNDDHDIAAGRTKLVVSLYDANGRYATEQNDDLGPLTPGWDADYSLYFTIDQKYGSNQYAEVTLYLDGKQVDHGVLHF